MKSGKKIAVNNLQTDSCWIVYLKTAFGQNNWIEHEFRCAPSSHFISWWALSGERIRWFCLLATSYVLCCCYISGNCGNTHTHIQRQCAHSAQHIEHALPAWYPFFERRIYPTLLRISFYARALPWKWLIEWSWMKATTAKEKKNNQITIHARSPVNRLNENGSQWAIIFWQFVKCVQNSFTYSNYFAKNDFKTNTQKNVFFSVAITLEYMQNFNWSLIISPLFKNSCDACTWTVRVWSPSRDLF